VLCHGHISQTCDHGDAASLSLSTSGGPEKRPVFKMTIAQRLRNGFQWSFIVSSIFVPENIRFLSLLHAYIDVIRGVITGQIITLCAKLSGAVYCYRFCLCIVGLQRAGGVQTCSQRARCLRLSERFFHFITMFELDQITFY